MYFLCGVKAALETGMFLYQQYFSHFLNKYWPGSIVSALEFLWGVQACGVPFPAASGEMDTTLSRGSRAVFERKHLQLYKVNWFSVKSDTIHMQFKRPL